MKNLKRRDQAAVPTIDRAAGGRKVPQFSWQNWRSKVTSLVCAMLIYSYYQAAIQDEVSFVLPVQTTAVQGMMVNFVDSHEVTLRLSGPANDLENLRSSDFETYIRLPAGKNGVQSLPVQYRVRNNSLRLSKRISIQVMPASISLVVEQRETREIPVEVRIQGYPAAGYNLGTYSVYPETVAVTGPISLLQELRAISTEPIDITGKSQPFQESTKLQLPGMTKKQLQLAVENVQVSIQIDTRLETQTLSITPRLTNLPKNLELLNILPSTVQVTLQGNSRVLQEIISGESGVRIYLDGGDIFTSGRYALPVIVSQLPDGVSLLGSTPNRVSVVLDERQ